LVAAPSTPAAPYVTREHGEVCVVEPGPNGGELKHCRREGSEYSGALARPAPTVKASPAEPEIDKERPPSQFGFAMKLGATFPFGQDTQIGQPGTTALHGRIGLRYALLDRSQKPDRGNLAFTLMGGGDLDGLHGGFAIETRVEATVGGDSLLLEPVFCVFAGGGAQYLMPGQVPEFHFGGGVSMDLLFSGVLGSSGLWIPAGSGNGSALAALLFILAPTLEYRYVVRGDGTHYNAFVLAMGM
jgi:hypothetical protein